MCNIRSCGIKLKHDTILKMRPRNLSGMMGSSSGICPRLTLPPATLRLGTLFNQGAIPYIPWPQGSEPRHSHLNHRCLSTVCLPPVIALMKFSHVYVPLYYSEPNRTCSTVANEAIYRFRFD